MSQNHYEGTLEWDLQESEFGQYGDGSAQYNDRPMNAQRRSLSSSAADLAHKTSDSSTSLQAEGGLGFTFDKTLRARQVRDNRTDGQMWLAEFCQRAGRYDDMLKIMEDVINSQEPGLPLFKEQQKLVFFAYERHIREQRRSLHYAEGEPGGRFQGVLAHYITGKKREIDEKCQAILRVLDAYVLPFAVSDEDRAYVYKLRGDYSRYLAEIHEGESRIKCMKASSFCYQKAYQLVTKKSISPVSALSLGVILNYSIFLSEFMKEMDKSQAIVRQALTYTTDSAALEAEDDETIYGMIELLRERIA
eukprot:g1904.t1